MILEIKKTPYFTSRYWLFYLEPLFKFQHEEVNPNSRKVEPSFLSVCLFVCLFVKRSFHRIEAKRSEFESVDVAGSCRSGFREKADAQVRQLQKTA